MYREALLDIIAQYKASFEVHRPQEIYKWEAVKCFQDNWDENDSDFASMLSRALGKEATLMLDSRGAFPRAMICEMAERVPEAVKAMFIALRDETQSITDRISGFSEKAELLRKEYNSGSWRNHYQTSAPICTYLLLMNPAKHYIYKYRKFKNFASKVYFPKQPKKGEVDSVIAYYEMCDAVLEFIKQDEELIQMSKDYLNSNIYKYYNDAFFHVLTDDVIFFGARSDIIVEAWWPSEVEYSPGIDERSWRQLLDDPSVFSEQSLTVMKRFLDIGCEATCAQLSEKYGETPQFYNGVSRGTAQRVFKKTQCSIPKDNNEDSKWWPILFVGKYASKEESGVYKWKLREELNAALKSVDLSNYLMYEPDKSIDKVTNDLSEQAGHKQKRYTKDDFLREVYMSDINYDSLKSLLENKLNVILYGPPGVGKTFTAKRLAYSMLGYEDDQRVKVVQFHQNYSYEDFVMGYKPKENGFELREGVFYKFCKIAEKADKKEKHFFIIDEINRGNLSKIFGELLMMIENGYRGKPVTMAYREEEFAVPQNIYIIGMMNTADRSLAMIDYALRRRFAFFEMIPAFGEDSFKKYIVSLDCPRINDLIEEVVNINTDICKDFSLDKGFCIGHSYFCDLKENISDRLKEIVDYDLVPLVNEYWYDNKTKADEYADKLRKTLSD